MNSKHKRLLAGILACLMLCMFAAPARVWADEAEDTSAAEQTVEENTSEQEETAETLPEETIHIASAEELLNFAESCRTSVSFLTAIFRWRAWTLSPFRASAARLSAAATRSAASASAEASRRRDCLPWCRRAVSSAI